MEEKAVLVHADTKDVRVTGDIESGSNSKGTHAPVAISDALTAAVRASSTIEDKIATADRTTDHAAATEMSSTIARSGKIDRLDPKKATKQRNLTVLSLLLAAVTLVVLWRSRGQPLLVVWLLSLMLCFMSSLWTVFLAETMGGVRAFLYNSYGILLAICVHAALSPSIGALVLHFNTHFAACLLGYALADHRQREGTEQSAANVRAIEKEEEFKLLLLCILAWLMASASVFSILTELARLVWHAEDYRLEELMPMVLFLLSAASVLAIFFVAVMQLRGSLISPLGFVFTNVYVGLVFAFHLCFSMILSDVAATVITWVACLGLPGFHGYSISVYATFKQIKRTTALLELQGNSS